VEHGVDSPFALSADEVVEAAGEPIWSVLDARRGEAFARPFRLDKDGQICPDGPMRAVATGDLDTLIGAARRTGHDAPTPQSLARAARQMLSDAERRGDSGDPLLVVPGYGREPDAAPRRLRVRLRELRVSDIDRLVALEHRCFDSPWSRGMYAEELNRPDGDAVRLGAEDGDLLVGAAVAARLGDSWHILNVMVDPASRRQGVAGQLVREILERTSELGVQEGWTLEVRERNDAAIALYEGFGFVNRGRRPGYYAETGEDALVMWRVAPSDGMEHELRSGRDATGVEA